MQLQAQTRPVEESKFEKDSSSGCESWRFCLIAKQALRRRLNVASPTSLRTADKRTFTVDALNFFSTMAARYSMRRARAPVSDSRTG